ncbi:MAG: hypothetical protein R2747_02465 [Pyrinomonadaceae bacterium]
MLIALYGFSGLAVSAQNVERRAETIRKNDSGDLYITVGGKEKMAARNIIDAWMINDGKEVLYSASDGSGGYENEGQSLRIYDVKTGRAKKIMSQYYMIEAIAETRLSDGKLALIVRMTDGGAGNNYISVVDPTRGEVFFRRFAEVLKVERDQMTLGIFEEGSWDDDYENPTKEFEREGNIFLKSSKPKHIKTETFDLTAILKNKVIKNPKDYRAN